VAATVPIFRDFIVHFSTKKKNVAYHWYLCSDIGYTWSQRRDYEDVSIIVQLTLNEASKMSGGSIRDGMNIPFIR